MYFPNQQMISIGDTNRDFWRPGWETLDLYNADYLCDVRAESLPFSSNTVDVINCSHVIEHLPYPDCSNQFLKECYRVLKPSGVLRISTPDAGLLVQKYLAKDWSYFLRCDGAFILNCITNGIMPAEALLIHNRLVGWFASYSARLDCGGGPLVDQKDVDKNLECMTLQEFGKWCSSRLESGRVYAHVNLYDAQRLLKELVAVGFSEPALMNFRRSTSPEINKYKIDRNQHRIYSLYVEAFK